MINTKFAIDSLKIRIPFELIHLKDTNLDQTLVKLNLDTGEHFDEFKEKAHRVETHGITTRFGLEEQRTSKGHTKKFLVILFNSKVFGDSRYFDGITRYNILDIYEIIMSMNIVEVRKADFLNAECTDVDFKADSISDNFENIIQGFYNHAKEYKETKKGCNKICNKERKGEYNPLTDKKELIIVNQGIEFGSRKLATPAYPFLKFYDKYLELNYHSKEFKDYAKLDVPKGIIRSEFTLKNKKHFRKYDIEDTTLHNILDLKQETLSAIRQDFIQIHLNKRTPDVEEKEGLSGKDILLYNSMITIIEGLVKTPAQTMDIMMQNINEKTERYRAKKKLLEIYGSHIQGTDIEKASIAANEYFDEIGWK